MCVCDSQQVVAYCQSRGGGGSGSHWTFSRAQHSAQEWAGGAPCKVACGRSPLAVPSPLPRLLCPTRALGGASYLHPRHPAAQRSWSSRSHPPRQSVPGSAASGGRQPPRGRSSTDWGWERQRVPADLGSALSENVHFLPLSPWIGGKHKVPCPFPP